MYLHGGPFWVSPFSLCIAGSRAEYLPEGGVGAGTAVLKQGPGIAIGGHLRLWLASTRSHQSPAAPGIAALPRGTLEWSTQKACGVVQAVAIRTYLIPPCRRE